MSRVRKIKKITNNRFLNYYELEAENREGKSFPYYMASRADNEEKLVINNPDSGPDGVAVYSLYGEKRDRVVLIRQYRYPLGGYVYEFPAGLIERGEDMRQTAVREMKEETGLDFSPLDVDGMFERPFFTTVGMTDETCSMVFGVSTGEVDLSGLESSEDIQVVLADRKEVRRILKEEQTALICAYMLMHFLQESEDPFLFLSNADERN